MRNENYFYSLDDNGNAEILHADDGACVTRLDDIEEARKIYPIDSNFSCHYEHAEGIAITVAEAESLGIETD